MTIKSKYLDLYEVLGRSESPKKSSILDDIDFEIELTRQDNINVSYIINLFKKDLDPKDSSFKKDVRLIHDLMQASHELKSKAELIDKFIHENIVEANGQIDIDEELPQYFEKKEKNKEIDEMVTSEKLI